jgi:uncharacterized protein (TIGR03083 family)
MKADIDFVDHLAAESERFHAAVTAAQPEARVPSCPDWNADDLLWHLGEVQWFWGTIVRQRLQDPSELQRPARPSDRAGLLAFFRDASGQLLHELTSTPPATEAWTWSEDHSVGFIRRRQAHEALIHRIDAELAAGQPTAVDSQLAADGVDEVLRVMYGGLPSWGSFHPDHEKTLRIRAGDTGDSWLVRLGRFTGTDADGTSYDEPDLHADDSDPGDEVAAMIEGDAADLDCWFWHRPTANDVSRTGRGDVLAELDQMIEPGIN